MRPRRAENHFPIKSYLIVAAAFSMVVVTAAVAATGDVATSPPIPIEQPVEIEVETAPGSLKQAPLWKELYQLLDDPYEAPERRDGFGVVMPDLDLWALDYNFLTAEPMRLRPSDGEVSLDQPGALFDPDEAVAKHALYDIPVVARTAVGALIASEDDVLDPEEIPSQIYAQLGEDDPTGGTGVACPTLPVAINTLWSNQTCGYLLVYNPGGNLAIPPDGTVVAVPAWTEFEDGDPEACEADPGTPDGRYLRELEFEPDGSWEGECEVVLELEAPVNEEDFLRDPADFQGIPGPVREYIGRPGAEILGKALFWDMQVGSDGVQACASCHFHAGADNRTVNQVNPDSLGNDFDFTIAAPNEGVTADDFPFRKLLNPDSIGDESQVDCDPCGDELLTNVVSDSNDVMSSMGVSEFKQFDDIPVIGDFLAPVNGVAALPPDLGTPGDDPIPAMDGFRRVEPRNTPTFHGAAFNLDNFWDSRARFVFNGGSVDGPSDPQFHIFIDPGNPNGLGVNTLRPANNEDIFVAIRGEDPAELEDELDEILDQPVRIKFSSLSSQAVGPPLSDFEMSFHGRNWPKIGKKLLQEGVTPLANQLVATDDSVLGPFSWQGGSECPGSAAPGKPGLCIDYNELIELTFNPQFHQNSNRHLDGCYTDGRIPSCAAGVEDPFDNYVLSAPLNGSADEENRDQFNQSEANFSLFFGQSVQAYENLTIPDDTAFDKFMDANPFAVSSIGQSGEQGVLFPTLVPDLVDDGVLNQSANPGDGVLTLIDAHPGIAGCQAEGPNGERGFCEEEVLGLDIFMGANLTAALPAGAPGAPGGAANRNPTFTINAPSGNVVDIPVGSNPFSRSARCMLCHLGPEQTDHSINISHGLLKGDAEFEFPSPPVVDDPGSLGGTQPDLFPDGTVNAPESPGKIQVVGGIILAEEVTEGMPQDAVEVEPRDFATFDDPLTWWDDSVIGQQQRFSFGDQGIYNIGVRPIPEDIGRGGNDAFDFPLSSSVLSLQNIAAPPWVPGTPMSNVDPDDLELTFEETGDGAFFGDTGYDLQSINPGLDRCPIQPMLPEFLSPWVNCLPAGELHPEIDEMSGMAPNIVTAPTGGPLNEFAERQFGADLHCGVYDPLLYGSGSPNFGWGPLCPNNQSGTAGNLESSFHGTWPDPNQVLRDGAFKAPSLRNVAKTGPYFHTGSFLTLRQVVDFYMRGGDFPESNSAHRDPNILNVEAQAFGFGNTSGWDRYFDCAGGIDDPAIADEPCGDQYTYLLGNFADALPDTAFLYDAMPDTDHPITPEYLTVAEAESALVSFLLALTDDRVAQEIAPFDHPELFVPLDGHAPENTDGRPGLVALSGVACPVALDPSPEGVDCFLQVPAIGATGRGIPVENFLGVLDQPTPGLVDHFDRVTDPAVLPGP